MAPQSVKEEGASETERIFVAVSDYTPSARRLKAGLINLFPILQGKAPQVERTLFWRTAGPSPVNMNRKAVRSGDWKLIIDGAVTRTFPFNLKADPGERQDWFAQRPDITQRLQQLLTDWERDVDTEARKLSRRHGSDARCLPTM
jgi:hypothetical protein